MVWDEITYPFPNFNGTVFEVWEWISNFIPHFTGHVIAYPCGLKWWAIVCPWTGPSHYEPVARFANPGGFWPDINQIYQGISLLTFMMILELLSSGYQCASKKHSHHRDVTDSVYWGDIYQTKFFQALQERGAYINQPDTYFYAGGSKTGKFSETLLTGIWYDINVLLCRP